MPTDTEEPNDWDYGFYSNHWMLKTALMYVPRQQLNLAIVSLIDAVVYGDGEEEILDILAQVALTGRYIHTREHEASDHPNMPVPDPESLPPEETEELINQFVDTLNNLSPDVPDPWADFNIEDYLKGKEDEK